MVQALGLHHARLADARALRTVKGRREQQRFLLEGPTLLREARQSGFTVDAIFATQEALERHDIVREMDAAGIPTFAIEPRVAAQLSELENSTGVIASARRRIVALEDVLREPGLVLVLADLADPGNAGTLVRAAEAFGTGRIVFGRGGVDPYNPKVVRAAMGSLFRASVAIAAPDQLATAVSSGPWKAVGLEAGGEPIGEAALPAATLLVVGHERRGLGPWRTACERTVSIPMGGSVESLNAAVAGAFGLYEAARRVVAPSAVKLCQVSLNPS
ncbi:MAG: RNA methyltransferase [Vulcanimicrobiaceae bacterium]